MDEIKTISSIDFNTIVSKRGFQRALLLKDYYLTRILFSLREVEGLYFKGGTAINKIILNHARLSEDIDFTLTRNEKEVKDEIVSIIEKLDFFISSKIDKNVDRFIRIIMACKSELGSSELFIDLNKRAKLFLPQEAHKINHFYSPFIPEFSVKTLAKEKFVVIGLSIYLISVVLWLIVLSKVDLSYAYPTLSISYVLTALLSRSFFKENVSKFRWLSIIIISIGVVMVVYS